MISNLRIALAGGVQVLLGQDLKDRLLLAEVGYRACWPAFKTGLPPTEELIKDHEEAFCNAHFSEVQLNVLFSSIAMWCKSLYQIILQNVHAKKVVDGKFVSSAWYFQWHYLVIAAASDGNGTAFAAAICLTWAAIGWEHPPNKPPLRGPTKPLWTLKPLLLPLLEPFSILCKWSCATKHYK